MTSWLQAKLDSFQITNLVAPNVSARTNLYRESTLIQPPLTRSWNTVTPNSPAIQQRFHHYYKNTKGNRREPLKGRPESKPHPTPIQHSTHKNHMWIEFYTVRTMHIVSLDWEPPIKEKNRIRLPAMIKKKDSSCDIISWSGFPFRSGVDVQSDGSL